MKKDKEPIYYRIAKRKNKNYIIIEQKIKGKTKHLRSLPNAKELYSILLERENNTQAENLTKEKSL